MDSDVLAEIARSTGATVVGRRMFSGGQGPWEDDPNPNASWWGDDPPFHHPVFVLTHHAREPVTMKGGTTSTFVITGIEGLPDFTCGDLLIRRDGRPSRRGSRRC